MPFFKDNKFYLINYNIKPKHIVTDDILSRDSKVDIRTADIYRGIISYTRSVTSFRLPMDNYKDVFLEKPLYLIIPFYFCYFITLLIITVGFTYLVYRISIVVYMARNNMAKKYFNFQGS